MVVVEIQRSSRRNDAKRMRIRQHEDEAEAMKADKESRESITHRNTEVACGHTKSCIIESAENLLSVDNSRDILKSALASAEDSTTTCTSSPL